MALLHVHRIKPPRCWCFFCVFQYYKKHQPAFGHGQPPKLQNTIRTSFLEAKLYIKGKKKKQHPSLYYVTGKQQKLISWDTPEAAKSGLLFCLCSTILEAFPQPWLFFLAVGPGVWRERVSWNSTLKNVILWCSSDGEKQGLFNFGRQRVVGPFTLWATYGLCKFACTLVQENSH